MKNKKGFTLIELLAVIVILAIIALIATPIILNMIENSRKGAAKASAYGYIDAIEKNNALADVNTNYTKIKDGTNINVKTIYIKLKGKLPKGGTITLEKGVVKNATLCINKYYVSYNGGNAEVTEPCDESNIKEIATFDGNGGLDGDIILKKAGEEIGTLPVITRDGYEFLGWFTEKEGGTQITEKTIMPVDGIIFYAHWKEIKPICIRATKLHEETCNRTSGGCYDQGYTTTGSKGTTTITYGNKNVTQGKLKSGDAFDCDVNGDGKYDNETERFYYVNDYYDTTSKTFDDTTAVLIYYKNTKDGAPDSNNSFSIVWGTENKPSSAVLANLPTNDRWSNISLKNKNRSILKYTAANHASIEYKDNTTRLLTYLEIFNAHSGTKIDTSPSYPSNTLTNCEYLIENTTYSNSNYTSYSLETTLKNNGYNLVIDGVATRVYYQNSTTDSDESKKNKIGVRPVIEVSKDDIKF